MQPTTNLRWCIRKNKVTAAQVRELADEWELSLSQAKAELEDRRGPILQQCWKADLLEMNPNMEMYLDMFGEWRDIPVEYEYDNAV